MSLVTSMLTRDGLVIAADKRIQCKEICTERTATKIRPIAKYTAIAVTGTVGVLDAGTQILLFSVEDEVDNFFKGQRPYFSKQADKLGHALFAAYDLCVIKPAITHPTDTHSQVIIFQYIPDAKDYALATLDFYYPHGGEACKWKWEQCSATRTPFMKFGNTSLSIELESGTDPRFDDLRKDQRISKWELRPCNPTEVSRADAVDFATFFIRECSKRSPLIDSTKDDIGTNVDVAMISKEHGFQWLAQ